MRRREFIALIGGAATTWPIVTRAEDQSKRHHIAMLLSGTTESSVGSLDAFRQGLRKLGLDEGQNVDVQYRYAEGDLTRASSLVAELVELKPDVIVTNFTAGAFAANQVTSAIPIVSWTLTDPVALGLVASDARPGGNVTGLLLTLDSLAGKILQLSVEMIPGISKVGVLINSENSATDAAQLKGAEVSASALGIKLIPVDASSCHDLGAAFQRLADEQVQVAFVLLDPMFFTERQEIAALALAARLPTAYGFREHVLAGGLISYGSNSEDRARRAADFVYKIVKGAKPSDIPLELPTKFELIINLKTAKALGLTVPPTLLARADEVIE